MEVTITFTFEFKVGDREYKFNITAPTEDVALKMLASDLNEMGHQINTKSE